VVAEYAEQGDLLKRIKWYQRPTSMRICEEELWRILSDVEKGIELLFAEADTSCTRITFCIGTLSQPAS
jgi:hypothetical protein